MKVWTQLSRKPQKPYPLVSAAMISRGPVWSPPLAFSKGSDYTWAARPHGVGAVVGTGWGTRRLLPEGEEMDVGEGRGQPGPCGQLGTVSAGESWLPTRLEAFAVAPLAPTGPRTAHLHPLASNILLLSAWLPGVTAPTQSNPLNVLLLFSIPIPPHPRTAPGPSPASCCQSSYLPQAQSC